MDVNYDSILVATDSNVINRSEFFAAGKGLLDHGIPMAERPYTVGNDENISYCLIVMFFIISLTLYRARLLQAYRLKTFFTSKRVYSDENVNDNRNESLGVILLTCVAALSQSLIVYYCVSARFAFPSFYDTPYWLLGAGSLLFLGLTYLRAFVYVVVNWIFFDDESQRRWNSGYFLVASVSSYVFYVFAIVSVFFMLSLKTVILCALVLYFLYEIVLFYKMLVNFRIKLYGTLLIFLYFCSVEILPLLLVWHFLDWIFNGNFVNNLLT